jgi:hypothetical protein
VAAELRALPAGTPVVLEDARPGGRRRGRRLAAHAAVVVDRSYLALPSLGHALYRVEDAPEARRYFATSLLASPPGLGRLTPVADAAVKLLERLMATPLAGALAPGRVTIGYRS